MKFTDFIGVEINILNYILTLLIKREKVSAVCTYILFDIRSADMHIVLEWKEKKFQYYFGKWLKQ